MSNIVEFSDPAAIERQAREWLIRLDAEAPLSREESEALHRWLSRSPAHRAELKRISQFWNKANVLTELAVPLQRTARTFRAPRFAAAASVLTVLLAGAAGGGVPRNFRRPTAAASSGQRTHSIAQIAREVGLPIERNR